MGRAQQASGGSRIATMPVGWYAVAESKELGRGQHLSRRYFDQMLRFHRSRTGEVGIVTPARLHRWPVREANGLIFVWYHPEGSEPTWEMPSLSTEGWTDFRFRALTVRSHPQETSENSVDIGHFVQLHGFKDAWYEGDLEVEGHLLKGAYGIDYGIIDGVALRMTFKVEVHGLGYSLVRVQIPRFGVSVYTLILSTPLDEERVHVRMGVSVKHWGTAALSGIIREVASVRLSSEVKQDAPIWEAKRYLERPILAEGDGPIGAYRRYCRQFYPEQAGTRAATAAPRTSAAA